MPLRLFIPIILATFFTTFLTAATSVLLMSVGYSPAMAYSIVMLSAAVIMWGWGSCGIQLSKLPKDKIQFTKENEDG